MLMLFKLNLSYQKIYGFKQNSSWKLNSYKKMKHLHFCCNIYIHNLGPVVIIRAGAKHFLQGCMCTQRRLRSDCAFKIAKLIAKDAKRPHADSDG